MYFSDNLILYQKRIFVLAWYVYISSPLKFNQPEEIKKVSESEGIERKGMVLSALVRLKQVCNHPAQFLGDSSAIPGRSGKLNRITEMLEEVLAEDDAAFIFTQFAERPDGIAFFRKDVVIDI